MTLSGLVPALRGWRVIQICHGFMTIQGATGWNDGDVWAYIHHHYEGGYQVGEGLASVLNRPLSPKRVWRHLARDRKERGVWGVIHFYFPHRTTNETECYGFVIYRQRFEKNLMKTYCQFAGFQYSLCSSWLALQLKRISSVVNSRYLSLSTFTVVR